jgi:hypothetical protein
MNSAASSYHDLARDLDSILYRSAPRPSNQNWPTPPTSNNKQNSERRSIGRRMSRAFARYSIVFLIGIGATLAWQSYRHEAMEMIRTEIPSIAWLLPVSTAKPPPDDQGSTTAAASSPQLERLELSLLNVRRSVEQVALMIEQLSAKQDQLATKQDQMSHIATLKSVESPPPSQTASPRKPPQPTAKSSSSAEYPSRLLQPDNPRTDGSSR